MSNYYEDSCGYELVVPVNPTDNCLCEPSQGLPGGGFVGDVQELMKLIDAKCDKSTCDLIQEEVEQIIRLLNLDGNGYPSTATPNDGNEVIDTVEVSDSAIVVPPKPQVQWVHNMIDILSGDLTDKYPSADLMKTELKKLWACLGEKHHNYGDWDKNFVTRDVVPSDDQCLYDDQGNAPGPKTITTRIPVDIGSTVWHTITDDKGVTKRCMFESLVNKNISEPTMATVLEGKWINYCDIQAAMQCLFPRIEITDCKERCDDPNHDGVHEGRKLCECVICEVVDTNTIDLTKTKLPKSKDNPLGQGNSIKADVILSKKACNGIKALADGLYSENTEVEVADTPSVDLTMTKTGCKRVLTVKVKLDPKACNALAISPAGMYTRNEHVTVEDTKTVDLTMDNSGCNNKLKGDVRVSKDAGNLIEIHPDGLYGKKPDYQCHYIKLDIAKNETVPTKGGSQPGGEDGWRKLGSSGVAPATGTYLITGAYWNEIAMTGTPCDSENLGLDDTRVRFKVNGHIVGNSEYRAGTATNGKLNPFMGVGTGVGFTVHLNKGDKIDWEVNMWRHFGSHCTVHHDMYLEGRFCELK